MKTITILLLMCAAILLADCSYQQKLGIDMPEGFPEARRQQVLKQFAGGKTAYTAHCASCHNKTKNGKEVIPDMTFEQLDTYRVRFANEKHKDELKPDAVTEQELDMIVIFFKYKKESGVPAF